MFFVDVFFLCFFVLCNCHVLLYDTEDINSSSEKFDCVYISDNVDSKYGGSSAGKIPYCWQPNITEDVTINMDKCENAGEIKYFADMLKDNIRPFEVLQWSSGIAMADQYAAFYYKNDSMTQSNEKKKFLCRCMHPSTFGRYCEYQLTHEANSFEASQNLQAMNRSLTKNHQIFGNILCYKTLSCNTSLLCLDWRDVCDGEQQCVNGWDEENCDKLEFNECEDDEYRCENGMCIPEQYWLDGEKDCMDWSDEIFPDHSGSWCFKRETTIDCDEHICGYLQWSCGDGQCIRWHERLIFQNLILQEVACDNLRNLNYMCEFSSLLQAWTLPNGLCWPFQDRYDDHQLSMNNTMLTDKEKCIYLIRCGLSDGLELDCPCDRSNCSFLISNICKDIYYEYPTGPVILPYVHTWFNKTHTFENKMPSYIVLFGDVKCRGYHGSLKVKTKYKLQQWYLVFYRWDFLMCINNETIRNRSSSMKYADHCWKNSTTFSGRRYAFYDVCKSSQRCISQYRINDGWYDCYKYEDENIFDSKIDRCDRVRQHRFRCSTEEPKCLHTSTLGDLLNNRCSNHHNKYLYGNGVLIKEIPCRTSNLHNCQLIKEHVKNSPFISNSTTNGSINTHSSQQKSINRIPFRSYCDTSWNLPKHIDELPQYCHYWVCHQDQYQCKTGQCIPFEWLCDGDWDCADASDEEALLFIDQWSLHNEHLKGLNERRAKCFQSYSNLSFSNFCVKNKEFPCLRSNVSDPLNFTQNRPCIPYEKIGDGIEDCYNAYDEKNTFENTDGNMWGFALQCHNRIYNSLAACQEATGECARVLCPHRYYPVPKDVTHRDAICINDNRLVRGGRCNKTRDCPYGEDEYWCAPGTPSNQFIYRFNKLSSKDNHTIFDNPTHPTLSITSQIFSSSTQSLPSSSIEMIKVLLRNSNVSYSFWCNKGVAVLKFNNAICFCPPSYFGDKCQFFSDRITIVTHLDLNTWPFFSTTNSILLQDMPTLFKIQVNFLFDEILVDHYEFHSNPLFELSNRIKHKFYLIYSRSIQMLLQKTNRFYNRTDIENNHPYSVHFDIYSLYSNRSDPQILGSWRYPIYFDFLPSFRLAKILRFPIWLGNSTADPCENHTCNPNSRCRPILNQNNSYFCSCKQGFYGKDCSKYDDMCNGYCSPNAICQVNDRSMITNTNKPFCICPFEYFGPRCYLKFEQCYSNPCLNNGTCVYTYELYANEPFYCNCSKFFSGNRCQHAKIAIQIQLNTRTISETPRGSTIQFYDVNLKSLELILRHQQSTEGLPSFIYWKWLCPHMWI